MTMQKQRLRDLWKCCNTPILKSSRKPSERAVRGAFRKELTVLENERKQLESELKKVSYEYRCQKSPDNATRVANLVVEIEGVSQKINNFYRKRGD